MRFTENMHAIQITGYETRAPKCTCGRKMKRSTEKGAWWCAHEDEPFVIPSAPEHEKLREAFEGILQRKRDAADQAAQLAQYVVLTYDLIPRGQIR